MSPIDIFLLFLLAGCQTIMATETWEVKLSATINGTADQVWPYVADFCNLYKIYPNSISFCDKGTSGKLGSTRYSITISRSATDPSNTTIVGWVKEELVKYSVEKKILGYDMHDNTFGITGLKATVQVIPAGKYRCTFKWNVVSDPFPGSQYEDFVSLYETSLAGLVILVENLLLSI